MRQRGFTQFDGYRGSALEVYLLPSTPWEQVVAFQQRLVYEVGGEPEQRAALILCEHPPILTVGRHGSRRHIRVDEHELRSHEVLVRWSNRGGGCWLFGPGQLAAYPIVPIDAHALGLDGYRSCLYETLLAVLQQFRIPASRDTSATGIVVGGREIASLGIAVKSWVAYHGCCLNVCSAPDRFDWVQPNPQVDRCMTSMFRELRTPIRVDAVRESFLHHFVKCFGFADYYLCNAPPLVARRQSAATVAS